MHDLTSIDFILCQSQASAEQAAVFHFNSIAHDNEAVEAVTETAPIASTSGDRLRT